MNSSSAKAMRFFSIPIVPIMLFVSGCAGGQFTDRPAVPLADLAPLVEETGFQGVVAVYDLRRDELRATHPELVDSRRIPASTFKIANALIALETGLVEDGSTILSWDSVTRSRPEVNQDLDLTTAFRVSAVPHFQELARQVGPERMITFLEAFQYGNRDIGGGIDQFWLTGDLRISPREQIDLLVKLHRGDLPVATRTMSILRGIMEMERGADHVLHAKTGWAVLPEAHEVGWWVGWVDRGEDAYFFATMIEADSPDQSFGSARIEVTRAVLRELGILPAPE
jgi:beta-lactamase class D